VGEIKSSASMVCRDYALDYPRRKTVQSSFLLLLMILIVLLWEKPAAVEGS
jgi:hypothetical protein